MRGRRIAPAHSVDSLNGGRTYHTAASGRLDAVIAAKTHQRLGCLARRRCGPWGSRRRLLVVARCDPAPNRREGQRNPQSGGGQKCLIGGNPSGLLRPPYAVTCLHVGVALTGSSFQVPTFPVSHPRIHQACSAIHFRAVPALLQPGSVEILHTEVGGVVEPIWR